MGIGFDFPKDGGSTNGTGMFDAWGSFSGTVMGIQSISATWTNSGVPGNGQTSFWFPSPGTWAAEVIGDMQLGTTITLTVSGMSLPDPTQPPVAVNESIRFTFQGPAPQAFKDDVAGHEEEY